MKSQHYSGQIFILRQNEKKSTQFDQKKCSIAFVSTPSSSYILSTAASALPDRIAPKQHCARPHPVAAASQAYVFITQNCNHDSTPAPIA
jgi:hypothetical protein